MATLFDSLNTLQDVQALVTDCVRESEVVEYKQATSPFADRDRNEISKDVSAFANSMGGTLVYGMCTDATDKTKPERIQAIDPKNIESFDRVVNANIRPPINGLRKRLIPASSPQIMVVDVPSSPHSPHQNLVDKKYYRRSGTESIPMEHDLVALHFGRRHQPLLEIRFVARPFTEVDGKDDHYVYLDIYVQNLGRQVARLVMVVFVLPDKALLRISHDGSLQNIDEAAQHRQRRRYENNAGVFHATTTMGIANLVVSFSRDKIPYLDAAPLIEWEAYADGMDKQTGVLMLQNLRDVGAF